MELYFAKEISGELFRFTEDESRHLIKVLRHNVGDEINITNGKGNLFKGVIVDNHPKRCLVQIISLSEQEKIWKGYIHLAVSPTKNISRIEWLMEKITEIGIDEISLLRCKFSERKVMKSSRLEKIIISAMKQSVKMHLPVLNEIENFDQFMKKDVQGEKLLAWCQENPVHNLSATYQTGGDVTIVIGPEGGFCEEEIALAKSFDYKTISLGRSRLRTETAALVAVHTIHVLNQL